MAARRSSSPTDYEAFEVGDQVRHPKWGTGSILFKSGTGESTKAIVVFPEQGQKKLLLKYAKLERISETPEADEDEFGVEEETAEKPKAAAPRRREEDDEEDDEPVLAVGGKDSDWDGEEDEDEEADEDEDEEDEEI